MKHCKCCKNWTPKPDKNQDILVLYFDCNGPKRVTARVPKGFLKIKNIKLVAFYLENMIKLMEACYEAEKKS
jgi:hypothetical protein